MLPWLISLSLLASGAPTGPLTIRTGDLTVQTSAKVGWIISSLDYQGEPMILPAGGQGALLGIGGDWLGGGATAEKTEKIASVSLTASTLEVGADGTQLAGGDQVVLHKESQIAQMKHLADTTFAGDLIVQRHQFEALEDFSVGSFYAFIYSLTPKAKQWLAQPLQGALLREAFTSDKTQKPQVPVMWMAQYDPATQKGLLLYYQQPLRGANAFSTFWDTDNYHKLFSQPLKGTIAKGTKLDLTLALRPFGAAPETWETKVTELAAQLQEKLPQTVATAPAPKRLYDAGIPEEGIMTLKSDHYTVPFRGEQAWTIYKIEHDGHPFSHERGFHGTVMIPKGGKFWGTGHREGGPEIVHALKLTVDGQEKPVKVGETYAGHTLTLVKKSTIWKFACTATVTVTDDHVYERTVLEALEPTELSTLYYFMHCLQPTSTKWLAELPDGTLDGGPLESKGGFKVNKDTRWVAQYDPTQSLGILCYTPQVITGPGSASLIWDLEPTRYHKYYLRQTTNQAFQKGDTLDYSVIVKVVPHETEDFAASKAAAVELAKQYPPVK